jgi:hypothetical protein
VEVRLSLSAAGRRALSKKSFALTPSNEKGDLGVQDGLRIRGWMCEGWMEGDVEGEDGGWGGKGTIEWGLSAVGGDDACIDIHEERKECRIRSER